MPNCNAFMESWNRFVGEELLDHRIVLGEHHLRFLLKEYVEYYNQNRPHQSFDQDSPYKKLGNFFLIDQRFGVSAWLTD